MFEGTSLPPNLIFWNPALGPHNPPALEVNHISAWDCAEALLCMPYGPYSVLDLLHLLARQGGTLTSTESIGIGPPAVASGLAARYVLGAWPRTRRRCSRWPSWTRPTLQHVADALAAARPCLGVLLELHPAPHAYRCWPPWPPPAPCTPPPARAGWCARTAPPPTRPSPLPAGMSAMPCGLRDAREKERQI